VAAAEDLQWMVVFVGGKELEDGKNLRAPTAIHPTSERARYKTRRSRVQEQLV
jgi:hypothetical protein